MYRYFSIGFIDFMLKDKSLLDYTNLFSPNDYEKNDKITINIFSITKKMNKLYSAICSEYRKFEKSKISYLLEKTLVHSICQTHNFCIVTPKSHPLMELMPLWQLLTMSLGRLHAKFEGLEPCASPFVNGFCDFHCFH